MKKKIQTNSFIRLLLGILFLSIEGCANEEVGEASLEPFPDVVSYNFHIRPILSDNCYACHGPDANAREAGLRLDLESEAYKALAENPGTYALVPGKPHQSEVYLRINSEDENEMMPPPDSNLKLTNREIELIKTWIKEGAVYEKHWAFEPPKYHEPPAVKDKKWPVNEIDYFILKRQEDIGLNPNEPASKENLLKRLSFDLTGLPPTLEMMDQFSSNEDPNAYETMVDYLLDQNAYGERMAVYWMDIARYADSYGYQLDNFRTQWAWRDWVIHAFNKNLSYKDFITWQLAGDLLENPTKEQILATGFNRNHKITEEGAVDEEEYRITYVTDRTNTVGKGILGITFECAACHDHKFDPISQKNYYEMFSFFNNIDELRTSTSPIDPLAGTPKSYAKKPFIEITDEDAEGILSFVNKKDTSTLIVSVMGELDTMRNNYILERGVFNAFGEEVFPTTPESILGFNTKYPKSRLGLARWLFDEKNPLTSRVFVNKIWKEFFGRGIVNTTGDFGMQGELPSHPDLLDWLAIDFMGNGWDMKRLVKQIVMSATYRQSVTVSQEERNRDSENKFYTYASRNHLKAEFIRNMVLSSSGLLVPEIGGRSVKPYQPDGLWEAATAGGSTLAEYTQDHGEDLYRRGLYTFMKRTVPAPSMLIFDSSNRDQCETERSFTNTPLQALVMLNDPTVLEASRVLASRLLSEKSTEKEKINKAFRLILCRKPKAKELNLLERYYKDKLATITEEDALELASIGEYPQEENVDRQSVAALMQVISTMYNMEESISRS
ncbi:PSD1 and planctomycete cytochrome C domain-containing protein [Cyclobacterium amurskyense]|uniref:PSD1 and planctomycete cytochrome C domain-containing protein n=1 Tax=Cyclobacterium amurskyense TaxID=320787 RepID=UPI0030DA5C92